MARALGPEQPGCIRGCGFGVTFKKLAAQEQIKAWKKIVYDELRDLKEWKNKMEGILTSGVETKKVCCFDCLLYYKGQ